MAGPGHQGPRAPGDRVRIRDLPEDRRLAILLRRSAMLCEDRAPYTCELLRRAAARVDPTRGLDVWIEPPKEDIRGWMPELSDF